MNIKGVKLANSVRVGADKEGHYFDSKDYSIKLDGNLIYIKNKKGIEVVTSLFNTIYLTLETGIQTKKETDEPKPKRNTLNLTK